ncbi:UDP-xylose transporter 3 [Populus alba x Populus x berolinensis]|nr:UDP-xylose transporter 3 [Populus alba x Populus x berolinensis]
MTNTIQKKFRVSSTQLLYQSCPYQALTLFIVGPFLDGLLTNKNVFAFKYTPLVLFFIVLSCLISVSVNFSTFLVIGKTSPVTYQVLGHLKTCLVLAFGYGLLRDHSAGATFWESSLQWLEWYCILTVAPLRISRSKMKHQQNCLRSRKVKTDPLISAENGAGILADGGVPKIKKSGNKTVSAMKMLLARVYHIAGVVQTAKFLLFVLWLYSYSSVKKNKYIPCPPKLPGSQLF